MQRELERSLGVLPEPTPEAYHSRQERLRRYINLQLITAGMPPVPLDNASPTSVDAEELLGAFRERLSLLNDPRCPTDRRIESFLHEHFADLPGEAELRLPERTLTLDRHGLARELSLPVDGDSFQNELIHSYRVLNGVLHNPLNDRRTTSGTFHVCEGGLPIPDDKKATPKEAFAGLFRRAFECCARCWHCRTRPIARSRWRPSCRCYCGRWSVPRWKAVRRKNGWRSASSRRAGW